MSRPLAIWDQCRCGCGRRITAAMRTAAERRGKVAQYATPACREREKQRRIRERKKQQPG